MFYFVMGVDSRQLCSFCTVSLQYIHPGTSTRLLFQPQWWMQFKANSVCIPCAFVSLCFVLLTCLAVSQDHRPPASLSVCLPACQQPSRLQATRLPASLPLIASRSYQPPPLSSLTPAAAGSPFPPIIPSFRSSPTTNQHHTVCVLCLSPFFPILCLYQIHVGTSMVVFYNYDIPQKL